MPSSYHGKTTFSGKKTQPTFHNEILGENPPEVLNTLSFKSRITHLTKKYLTGPYQKQAVLF